jgi:hypothetical protein
MIFLRRKGCWTKGVYLKGTDNKPILPGAERTNRAGIDRVNIQAKPELPPPLWKAKNKTKVGHENLKFLKFLLYTYMRSRSRGMGGLKDYENANGISGKSATRMATKL